MKARAVSTLDEYSAALHRRYWAAYVEEWEAEPGSAARERLYARTLRLGRMARAVRARIRAEEAAGQQAD